MLKNLLSFLDSTKKELKRFEKIADQIEALKEKMESLSDEELKQKTEKFKNRLQEGETLDDVLIEAFAVVREASKRVIDQFPFRTQLIVACALHYGNIAEMKTGEGKTLASVLAGYLNALKGEGVHLITVNEYLASFQGEWMGKIYEFLGMSVGVNLHSMNKTEKREAYAKDITYTTNNELGFDYLRDNMVVKKEDRVMRGLNFVIIDEVDSILIDEARTPLIISGGKIKTANEYINADNFVKSLSQKDIIFEEKTRSASLTEQAVEKAEKYFKLDNLYDINNTILVHHINLALKANFSLKKDTDYIVREDKIVIVDQFTGRIMEGRNYSEGLHQAIEAKEGVTIGEESRTLATITFQNLFRLYNKLSGMTGTAKTEEEEFRNIYNMYVIEIPTNKPVIRKDMADLIYSSKNGKYNAIINEIKKRHKVGQPILVGTIAIETSELISRMLKKENIKHEVINAKNHAREAQIVDLAGQKNAVTIATNMAGRGTDIKLGEGVKELGGLCVIGTERHESRRIDNQLRGRSGRQGDAGYSQFFISLEDDLMVRFGTSKVKGMLEAAGLKGDQAVRSKVFTKSIESAQKRVEGNNFDARKRLLDFDEVIGRQRKIIYDRRNTIIDSDSIHDSIVKTIEDFISIIINNAFNNDEPNYQEIIKVFNENLLKKDMKLNQIEGKSKEEIIKISQEHILKEYQEKLDSFPEEFQKEFEKAIALRVIDTHWMEHINAMAHLREGVNLRGYAQENPLIAYTNEGFKMFDEMLYKIEHDTSIFLMRAEVKQNQERVQVLKGNTNTNPEKTIKKQPKKVTKIGRNDPCPCGSGKKYKHCCGK